MFVCRLVISVQGVIIIDLSSLGRIVPEIFKSKTKKKVQAMIEIERKRTLASLNFQIILIYEEHGPPL